jgi:excisionase family DNA binding protein
MSEPIRWMGTSEACERLGVTLRTLYRFIDEGQLTAYKMGRVIRVQETDIETFIEHMRIVPGTLEHLYPEPKPSGADAHPGGRGEASDAVADLRETAEPETVND